MTLNHFIILVSIFILALLFIGYRRAFSSQDVPTCDGYLLNVYLYVLFGLLVTVLVALVIAKKDLPVTTTKSLIAFAVALGFLIALRAVSARHVILNHIIWLGFLVSIAFVVYSVWRYSVYSGVLVTSLISVILLVTGLTLFVHMYPNLVSLSWGSGLLLALVAGILAWIVPMLMGLKLSGYYRALSIGFIFLFGALILYDTKLLKERANNCVFPNYPSDSLGLFLDILNMFSSTTNSLIG